MIAAVAMRRRFGQEAPVGTVGRADRAERPLLAGQRIQRLAPEARPHQRRAGDLLVLGVLAEAVDRAEGGGRREKRGPKAEGEGETLDHGRILRDVARR